MFYIYKLSLVVIRIQQHTKTNMNSQYLTFDLLNLAKSVSKHCYFTEVLYSQVINRPGLAGAVLKTALSLIK